MKAIILSAGQGSRLLPHTTETPKCLLPTHGHMSLLECQLAALDRTGIKDTVIVTGFNAEKVDSALAAMPYKTRTIYNPFYKVADNLGSVWMAREEMTSDFILINGDTLFTATVPENLLTQAADDGITVTISRKDIFDDDDMKVVENGGRLLEIGKRLQRADVNAESIGMIAFRGRGTTLFRDEVERRMHDQSSLKSYYLSIIDDLAKTVPVSIAEAAQDQWCEVDFPHDLEYAREKTSLWNAAVHEISAAIRRK